MPDGADTPRFRLIARDELASLPEVRWIVDGLLAERSVAVLYGESGIGKTFLSLAIGAGISAGQDVFGCTVEKGPVIYLAGEGAYGLRTRLGAWESFNQSKASDLVVCTGRPAFASSADVQLLISTIEAALLKPRLVVIDTFSAHFTGGNENDAKDVTRFLDGARQIAERFAACVLIVHHTGKNLQDFRGSYSIKGNTDTLLRADENALGNVTLTCERQRDGPEDQVICIDLIRHSYGNDSDSSLVATLAQESDVMTPAAKAASTKHEATILGLLAQGPLRRKELLEKSGIPEGSIDSVTKALQGKGLIRKLSTDKRAPFILVDRSKP